MNWLGSILIVTVIFVENGIEVQILDKVFHFVLKVSGNEK